MGERRPERVAHLVQAELARLLLREVNDPRLRDVTVTAVRMSADLRVARVFVRSLAGAVGSEEVLRGLRRAGNFLRGEVGRALGLRATPELRFAYDTLPDTAQRVDDLLRRTGSSEDDEDGT